MAKDTIKHKDKGQTRKNHFKLTAQGANIPNI